MGAAVAISGLIFSANGVGSAARSGVGAGSTVKGGGHDDGKNVGTCREASVGHTGKGGGGSLPGPGGPENSWGKGVHAVSLGDRAARPGEGQGSGERTAVMGSGPDRVRVS